MCRGARICTELGDQPDQWSKECPLLPPSWFDEELAFFSDAVRSAARGAIANAQSQLLKVRSDDIRQWYVEHGQNSGGFRYRHLGKLKIENDAAICDETRLSPRIEEEVFRRDGFRCRYCEMRLVSRDVLKAFNIVVGSDSFPFGSTNQGRHGVVLAFRACVDHVVHWKHGGPTTLDNLVTACWSCNFGKYHFTLQQIGLEDPRTRPPQVGDGWDGLTSLIPKLQRAD